MRGVGKVDGTFSLKSLMCVSLLLGSFSSELEDYIDRYQHRSRLPDMVMEDLLHGKNACETQREISSVRTWFSCPSDGWNVENGA